MKRELYHLWLKINKSIVSTSQPVFLCAVYIHCQTFSTFLRSQPNYLVYQTVWINKRNSQDSKMISFKWTTEMITPKLLNIQKDDLSYSHSRHENTLKMKLASIRQWEISILHSTKQHRKANWHKSKPRERNWTLTVGAVRTGRLWGKKTLTIISPKTQTSR